MHDGVREISFRWWRGSVGGDGGICCGLEAAIRWCRVARPTGYRLAPLPGCEFVGCEVPVVSRVPSSTIYEPSSLRDEEAGGMVERAGGRGGRGIGEAARDC